MPRMSRVDFPGARHHVMNRGSRREIVFDDDACCVRFLELLADLPRRFGVIVHGYALMPNHFHLMLECPRGNLSRAMHALDARYAAWLNHRRERDGAIWRGRFTNRVVLDDAYWRHLLTYLHLNPVGSLVAHPDQAVWTSHQAYSAMATAPEWLRTDELLDLYGSVAAYREYLLDVMTKSAPIPDGFDAEALWTGAATGAVSEHCPAVGAVSAAVALEQIRTVTGKNLPALQQGCAGRPGNRAGWVGAWWLATVTDLSHREIGELLAVSSDVVSKRIRRARTKKGTCGEVRAWMLALEDMVEAA